MPACVPVWDAIFPTQKTSAPEYWLITQPDHAALLPVTIADSPTNGSADIRSEPPRPGSPGTIHVKLPQAQVRIDGGSDVAWLRMVLECLLR